MNPLLQVDKLVAGYGPVTVLNELSLAFSAGRRYALLGRNGVGKSTALKAIMGLADVTAGTTHWDGQDITRLATHQRARRGLGYVPQTRDVFPSLTVEENLIAGLKQLPKSALDEAYALFPRLAQRRDNAGHQLSGGEQQMLSVARAVLGQPRLLLLDEPLEGLAPKICEELLLAFEAMARTQNLTVVIVEQQVHEALAFTDHAIILEHGSVVHSGPSAELVKDSDILDRYVGVAVA